MSSKESKGKRMTKSFEGFRGKIYMDSKGNPTIGYGFNLKDAGVRSLVPREVLQGKRTLTPKEADPIFENLYNRARNDAQYYAGERFHSLNPHQQDILTDMAYNLGLPKLLKFEDMRKGVQSGDENMTIKEMKDSDWFNQVGRRSKHHYNTYKGNSINDKSR